MILSCIYAEVKKIEKGDKTMFKKILLTLVTVVSLVVTSFSGVLSEPVVAEAVNVESIEITEDDCIAENKLKVTNSCYMYHENFSIMYITNQDDNGRITFTGDAYLRISFYDYDDTLLYKLKKMELGDALKITFDNSYDIMLKYVSADTVYKTLGDESIDNSNFDSLCALPVIDSVETPEDT